MTRFRVPAVPHRLRSWLAVLPVLALTFVARAQDTIAAPQPNLQKSPPVWLGLLVIFVMLAMVVSVSLLPSRRGHQD